MLGRVADDLAGPRVVVGIDLAGGQVARCLQDDASPRAGARGVGTLVAFVGQRRIGHVQRTPGVLHRVEPSVSPPRRVASGATERSRISHDAGGIVGIVGRTTSMDLVMRASAVRRWHHPRRRSWPLSPPRRALASSRRLQCWHRLHPACAPIACRHRRQPPTHCFSFGFSMARRLLKKPGPDIPSVSRQRRRRMNWDRIEGNWRQFKGKVKEQWGKLTDDDIDRIAGKRDQLVGRLQEQYGISKDEAENEVRRFGETCDVADVHHDR
jgi:uncharacterized protein YjbJ (UPF0337 family)